jgi:hypothetical protein
LALPATEKPFDVRTVDFDPQPAAELNAQSLLTRQSR